MSQNPEEELRYIREYGANTTKLAEIRKDIASTYKRLSDLHTRLGGIAANATESVNDDGFLFYGDRFPTTLLSDLHGKLLAYKQTLEERHQLEAYLRNTPQAGNIHSIDPLRL